MKKVLLCGCNGRMGRVVRDCISKRSDITVIAGIDMVADPNAPFPIYAAIADCKEVPDVLIDFSHPSLLGDILNYAAQNKIPSVLSTTGFSDEQIAMIKDVSETVPIFFSFNMSLGVNLLVELAKKAVQVLGDQFDIEIIEKHHNQKIDAPSGTAIMLANAINSAENEKYQYVYDRHSVVKKRDNNEVGIHSVRGGTIVGEHEIIFAGRDETISLKHSATSKEIFAVGAVNAALYVSDQKPGLYSMHEMISD